MVVKRKIELAALMTVVVAALLLFAGRGTVAQETKQSAPQSQYKIGVVDVQKVMDGYNKRIREVEKLQKEAEKLQTQIDSLESSFDKKRKDYDAVKSSLSEEERARREEDLDASYRNLRNEYQRLSDELKSKELRLKAQLVKDIVAAIEKIGVAENYHLILETEKTTKTGVLYFSEAMNITPKVLQLLNGSSASAAASNPGRSEGAAKAQPARTAQQDRKAEGQS